MRIHTPLALSISALILLASPDARAGSFSDDFSSGLRPAFWKITQTTPGQYTVSDTGGFVRLARPAPNNPGGLQNVTIELNLGAISGSVGGDFSCQVDISSANLAGGGLNQIELHTHFTDGSIFFNVYDNNSGLNTHVWNGSSVVGATATSLNAGTLRIQRVGSTLSALFNGSTFYSVGKATPLRRINFVLQNNTSSNALISCNYDNFAFTFQKPCRADLNLDAVVDDTDFSAFVVAYDILDCADATMPPGCPADLNGDGLVDDADFSLFAAAYNELLCP